MAKKKTNVKNDTDASQQAEAPLAPETEEFSYTLKIPADRVGVLIGTSGQIKKQVEQETNSKIAVDSKEGEVTITATNGLHLYDAREVIRAIARGFNPDTAMLLLKGDYALEIITIPEFTGKNKKAMQRLKGRIIGAEGKAKHEIEHLTDTSISIYGKTVSIIGDVENVSSARRAVESLLEGSTHASVYHALEKRRRERRFLDITGKEKP